MINKKALLNFLGITFGLTIALSVVVRLIGYTLFDAPIIASQLVVAGSMFFPALGAILTQKFIVKKPLKELGFVFGPRSFYFRSYFLILAIFIVNYAITWLFVLKPDFTLTSFMAQYKIDSGLPLPASRMIAVITAVTFIVAPIVNMIPSLGEEIGWRGFLLPALEPLGKIKAILFSGMIWASWHTPMILILGFAYGRQFWPGALLHFIAVTGLGIWMGYIWLKTRSTVLAAFIHSVFNANAYGIWSVLFVSSNKLIVGAVGVIGAGLLLILGLITIYHAVHEHPAQRG